MHRIPIALEMYSVRHDFSQAPLATMQAVKDMGYDGVEFAGAPKYCQEFYAGLLKQTGLTCCGWHTPWELVQDDKLQQTIELNRCVNNRYIIIPWLDAKTQQDWIKLATEMNRLADKLAPYGMRCGYHNHAHDFKLLEDKKPWDCFAENTYKKVILQLDTGNALAAGADPMQALKKYPGRAETIHLKPYSNNPEIAFNSIIGEDDVPWEQVWQYCQNEGNTEWAIVEYECPETPALEAVEKCIKALRKMGF